MEANNALSFADVECCSGTRNFRRRWLGWRLTRKCSAIGRQSLEWDQKMLRICGDFNNWCLIESESARSLGQAGRFFQDSKWAYEAQSMPQLPVTSFPWFWASFLSLIFACAGYQYWSLLANIGPVSDIGHYWPILANTDFLVIPILYFSKSAFTSHKIIIDQ